MTKLRWPERTATHKSHSTDTVDLLSDLLHKAQTEFDDTRHAEPNSGHDFTMLEQSLEDQKNKTNMTSSPHRWSPLGGCEEFGNPGGVGGLQTTRPRRRGNARSPS